MPILQHSEYHPGGYCRTVFAMSEVFAHLGDFDQAALYGSKGQEAARACGLGDLGTDPQSFEKFVGFPYR